ncbi:MAG: metallophosphoesterase, partial [Bacteroidota bacterium]
MKPFVIYQITDLHLPDDENHEIGLRFKKLMEFISSHPPDLLAITGDLTMTDGSKQICQRIKDSIPRQMEYAVIPGNHDDAVVLNEVFDNRYDSLGEFCYSIPLDSIDLLFVDSSSHILPENHIDFINNQDLRSSSILFIHHPP